MNKDKQEFEIGQKKAQEEWCHSVGLVVNDFTRNLAPVIYGEWEKKDDIKDN